MSKPKCKLVGSDSNIFNLVGIASKALARAGQADQAKAMSERVFASDSFDNALCVILEYVDDEGAGDDGCEDCGATHCEGECQDDEPDGDRW